MPLIHGPSRAVVLRWLTAATLLGGVLASGPAAEAATAKPTSLHLKAAAASFHTGAPVVLIGTVSPRSTKPVALERLVGKTWVVVAHAEPSTKGAFTFTFEGSKANATWPFRAVRVSSGLVKAGVSAVLKAYVVKAIFTVTATVPATAASGTAIVVTGKVAPKATGTVWLQTLSGTTWRDVVSAKLSRTSTFVLSTLQPVGVHRLRVITSATTRTAAGTSAGMTTTVATAVPPPHVVLTVAALPQGTAELPYHAQLVASGGTGPYQFSVASLPVGLTASAGGAVSGVLPAPVSTTVSVTVIDAASNVTSVALPLVFVLSPYAADVVLGWGNPFGGTLGAGVTAVTSTPIVLAALQGITAVAGSDTTGYALRFDGTVFAYGSDGSGELGDNGVLKATGSDVPLKIAGLTGVTAIAADGSVALALRSDGTVWGWGDNTYGQVGDGTVMERDAPVQVSGLVGVTSIAAASDVGYALTSDGTVWAWGKGSLGGLGDNSLADSSVPVAVSGLTGVKAISARNGVAAAVRADGSVWDWGIDNLGQLGDLAHVTSALPVPSGTLTGAIAVAVGSSDSYAVLSDGSLWAWGDNSGGQLGTGTTAAVVGPVKVKLSNVVGVSAGAVSVTARLADGTAWSWGLGTQGRLGDGLVSDTSLPAEVTGVSHALALANGGFASYAVTGG